MRKIFGAIAIALTVGVGAAAGYKLATDDELRGRISRNIHDVFNTSKQRVGEMTEEVAVRTAKMTKNPKITQDWVAKQWDTLGY